MGISSQALRCFWTPGLLVSAGTGDGPWLPCWDGGIVSEVWFLFCCHPINQGTCSWRLPGPVVGMLQQHPPHGHVVGQGGQNEEVLMWFGSGTGELPHRLPPAPVTVVCTGQIRLWQR